MPEPEHSYDLACPSYRDWELIEMSVPKTGIESHGWVWVTRIGSILVILGVLAAIVLYVVRAEVSSSLSPIIKDTATNTQAITDIGKRIDELSRKVDQIPASILSSLLPDANQGRRMTPGELKDTTARINRFLGVMFSASVPTDPSLLSPMEPKIINVTANASLPDDVRSDWVSTLVQLRAYKEFSIQAQLGHAGYLFDHVTIERFGTAVRVIPPAPPSSIVFYNSTIKETSTSFD
jgi:hypothetical protein